VWLNWRPTRLSRAAHLSRPTRMPSQATTSGIVTDENSGERHIPESTRADGSTRKAIKIRPGYRPPEDVEVYKNRTAETFRNAGKGPPPGAEELKNDKAEPASAVANKNAKRREARKKAKAAEEGQTATEVATPPAAEAKEEVDPAVEREKKARGLKKKLKQARDLKSKKDEGGTLLPEQIAKVIKINELIRELESLGFDAEGEPFERDSKEAKKSESSDKGT
jgi:partner of Y14 and mago